MYKLHPLALKKEEKMILFHLIHLPEEDVLKTNYREVYSYYYSEKGEPVKIGISKKNMKNIYEIINFKDVKTCFVAKAICALMEEKGCGIRILVKPSFYIALEKGTDLHTIWSILMSVEMRLL